MKDVMCLPDAHAELDHASPSFTHIVHVYVLRLRTVCVRVCVSARARVFVVLTTIIMRLYMRNM